MFEFLAQQWVQMYLYALPLAIALFNNTFFTVGDIREEFKRRKAAELSTDKYAMYHPRLTYGRIIGRVFGSVCPVVNLFVGVISSISMTKHGVEKFEQLCDVPVVPTKKRVS